MAPLRVTVVREPPFALPECVFEVDVKLRVMVAWVLEISDVSVELFLKLDLGTEEVVMFVLGGERSREGEMSGS